MYFFVNMSFLVWSSDVIFFSGWYPYCVKSDPAVLSSFKKSCWTDWNRMSCGLCKGSENICLVLMEIQETYRNQSQKSLPTRRETLKRKEPLRRERTVCDQLFQDTLADLSCLFWCWIFLRLLDLWLHEFLHVELQRAHMHWPCPQSHLQGTQGWKPRGCACSRELPVQIQVKMHFYIFYCKCQSSHFLYSVLILYVK